MEIVRYALSLFVGGLVAYMCGLILYTIGTEIYDYFRYKR